MVPVHVILSDANGDELKLGPFRSGVAVELGLRSTTVIDVITREVITHSTASFWMHESLWYQSAVIQALEQE